MPFDGERMIFGQFSNGDRSQLIDREKAIKKPRSLTPGFFFNALALDYFTPSFFCRLEDEVVYWKTTFLSG